MKNIFLILYVLLGGSNIFASIINHSLMVQITKPFLMLLLIGYFLQNTIRTTSTFRKLIVAALFFSWLGDTFLMFVENPPYIASFFLFGLLAFLVTHLFYAYSFLKVPKTTNKSPFLKEKPFWIVPFILFLMGSIYLFWPGIEAPLKIPVVIYSSVIVGMALCCLQLKGRIPENIFLFLFLGVLLFVASDTLIGVRKFREPFFGIQGAIMVLYLAGQWLIAEGSIKMNNFINKLETPVV